LATTLLGIDIGSTIITAIIAEASSPDDIRVIGAGFSKANGIKKGVITNIELASKSIQSALVDAKKIAGTPYDKVIVSISGSYVKSINSNGVVNVPNREIGIHEINRVMQMADHNANIPQEYQILHMLPYNFKVDAQDSIDDPLGMNGSRLQVDVHIITAQISAIVNLKKAVKYAGAEVDNIVLNSYASSIATINDDEKELGAGVIDMGGATCNIAIHLGNSLRYNDFLGVGSSNITSDISMAIHTPVNAAEQVKLNYGSLLQQSNETIELPSISDDRAKNQVSLEIVTNVIYARVEETLMLLAKSIEKSGFKDLIGGGIILTGGMTKLEGIRELASAIFDNMPVRIAKPKELEGMFEALKDPAHSTGIGLLLYGAGHFTPYEIDSNKKLKYKDEKFESRALNPHEIDNILEEETLSFDNSSLSDVALDRDGFETPGEGVERVERVDKATGQKRTHHQQQSPSPRESLAELATIRREKGLKEKMSNFWNQIIHLF
jgi:cell division protein FtsA